MIKKFEIDLSEISGYIDGEEDKIIQGQLKKQRLYNKNCLYSVFNGRRENQILRTGNYRKGNLNSIFAFIKNDFVWETDIGINNDIKNLSNQYIESPAIAIYNKTKFYQGSGDYKYEYFFKNPNKKLEALLGIAFLNFKKLAN